MLSKLDTWKGLVHDSLMQPANISIGSLHERYMHHAQSLICGYLEIESTSPHLAPILDEESTFKIAAIHFNRYSLQNLDVAVESSSLK